MVRLPILSLIATMLIVSGCDDPQRTARVEKENAELKAQLNEKNITRNYDLEARCSKDAKAWFHEHYQPDKDTLLLDFTNHYNLASNQCFVLVELHLNTGGEGSWVNNMSLWNVYENSRYGNFSEDHDIDSKNGSTNHVFECEMLGSECTTINQFNGLAQTYMSN
jgi:hypothetical protein